MVMFHRRRVPLRAFTRRAPRSLNRIFAGLAALSVAGFSPSVLTAPATTDLAAMKAMYRRPEMVRYPRDNPYSLAKADLGHKLFFDPRVSGTGTLSCASCHNPGLSWSDGLPTAVGSAANHLGRRSPSILNLAWADALFWDGRADTLEQQSVGPMMAPGEMNQTMPRLVALLSGMNGYRVEFGNAFPGEAISEKTIARAIATFERTVVSAKAPFDLWIGGQENAIDESAKQGFVTFNTKANCAACHSGWRFTDDSFNDIGLAGEDLGRGALIQGVEPLQHAFKTPGLRNVALRAPYMHDGSIQTLAAVIDHYDHGFIKRPSLSSEIYKLNLTDQDKKDLVAFLMTLTSVDSGIDVPMLPVADARR